jgi:hypothetical protein
MHTLTKVTASQGRNAETERTIDSFLNTLSGAARPSNDGESSDELVEGHNEVVGILSDDYTSRQVSELARNPFDVSSQPVVDNGSGEVDDSEYAKAMRRDMMERAAEEFELKSIIMGTRPLANLNGRIVRVNQVVPVAARGGGVVKFRVASIQPESVTLVAEDPVLEIRVERVLELKR